MPESNQIELRHYRYFMAVAKELHFRKAAESLFITQPGLSRQIKQLEEILGVELIERSNKSVRLTAAGEHLNLELKKLFNLLTQIHESTLEFTCGNRGSVHLGYVGSAMHDVLPKVLVKFAKKYPSINFNLTEMDNNEQVKRLLDHTIDVGFVRLNQVPSELQILPVKKENFSVVLPLNHKLNTRNFKSVKQLEQEEFILFEREYSPVYHERIMSIFEDNGFSPKVSHKSVHATTIFRLVESGFGVAIVPNSLQQGYEMNIKFIELKNITQKAVLFMIWHKDNHSMATKHFLEEWK